MLKNYLFFLSGFQSNWYRCQFKDNDGIIYNCTEQYIMYKKAELFGDMKTAEEILKTFQPRFQKSLGRKVKNFDEEVWIKNREKIAYEGNLLKYQQNSRLKKLLINTYPKEIVECNPHDRIWGIGLAESDPDILKTELWGENLMGKTLMKVRETLMNN